ncbi:hypothetical protein [Arachidicoccus sp.]|uniref:hypothetical protein n=1 Tax=Arachidicoccus sp. TaxID=1872624 RepID=UPI003D20E489
MKIKTTCIKDGELTFIEVEATKIVIPGWEEYDFYIHREYVFKNFQSYKIYKITEYLTGTCVKSVKYKKDAVKETTDFLNKIGKSAFKKRVKEIIKQYGL